MLYINLYLYFLLLEKRANGKSESSKDRWILDEKNYGKKSDFHILSKIEDINMEFLFKEIKL